MFLMTMRGIGQKLLLILLVCTGASDLLGQSTTVWPGDANNNGLCSHFDVLAVAANMGLSGTPRNTVTTTWAPQALPQLWNAGGPALPDAGYSDCDGSGGIDLNDFAAIQNNFGLIWGGVLAEDSSYIVASGAAPLAIQLGPDSLLVNGTTTFALTISLGDSMQGVDSILGVAFSIQYDTLLVDAVGGFSPGTFFTQDSSYYGMFRDDRPNQRMHFVVVRTNHFAVSGSGTVGTVVVALDDNIRVASNFSVGFQITKAMAINGIGQPVGLVAVGDSLEAVTAIDPGQKTLAGVFYPNPAAEVLCFNGTTGGAYQVEIMDLSGRIVGQYAGLQSDGELKMAVGHLPNGLYVVQLRTETGLAQGKLCIRHESE